MNPSFNLDTTRPPHLNRDARVGGMPENVVRESLRGANPVAVGLALLWNNHWNAAHEIAQADEGERDHDLLHYFVHRREGDFGNAGYWLRAAERHPCLDSVGARVGGLITSDTLRKKVLHDGQWNPRGFLEAVKRGIGGPDETLLHSLQAEEMMALWTWLKGDR